MSGRNKFYLRNVAENLKGKGGLRQVEEYMQTLLYYSVVESIYANQVGKI
jgi:hypothetical protein